MRFTTSAGCWAALAAAPRVLATMNGGAAAGGSLAGSVGVGVGGNVGIAVAAAPPQAVQVAPVAVAVAQAGGSSSSSSSNSGSSGTNVQAAAAATHTITVGGADLVFNPPQIQAAVGDTVVFMFMAKNHTATQSTFNTPCVKMAGGFDSGFQANANGTMPAPMAPFTVSVTTPLWFYCRQKTPVVHCGMGMVFAINPTADKSFATFQSMAKAQNGTAAAAAAAAVSVATTTASAVTLSVNNGAGGAAVAAATTTTAAAALSQATNLVSGWNMAGNSGACTCACFCGVAAFPVGAGIGSFGGLSGALPAPW